MTPAVTVIIPARDASATLERTLVALEAQTLVDPFEVVVVDDGSRDATPDIVRRHERLARLIENSQSGGAGGARNRGVEVSAAPVLAFTDADCFPGPEWLAAGLEALEHADLVQGQVQPDPAVARTPFDRSLEVDRDGGFYQTANLFVRRSTFDAVGGFRDWALEGVGGGRGTPNGMRERVARRPVGEDTLFAWSARRLGAISAYAPAAVVHHVVEPGSLFESVAERWHWSTKMADLARRVPELREETFHRHVFFNQVTTWFDCAVAGVVLAALTRQSCWLLAARPYVRHLLASSGQWAPRERLTYLAGAPVVEAATLAGLVSGSVAARSLVI